MIAVLFVRDDSAYKSREGLDCYDKARDAVNFDGCCPVIAHPPCRLWGKLASLGRVKPRPGEKELAFFAIDQIHRVGGVLEHPQGSGLWKAAGLPTSGLGPSLFSDGYTLLIDQWDFGHVAHKPTWIYIFGCNPEDLPPLPPKRGGVPLRSISGEVEGTTSCTQYQREYTPEKLIDWLVSVATLCGKP